METKLNEAVIAPLYLHIEGKYTFYRYVMNVRFKNQDQLESFEEYRFDTLLRPLNECLPDGYGVDNQPYMFDGFEEDDGKTSFLLDIITISETDINKIDYKATKISESDFLKDAKLLDDADESATPF